MKPFISISDENGFIIQHVLDELRECLEKCEDCIGVITLKQSVVNPEGKVNSIDLNKFPLPVKLSVEPMMDRGVIKASINVQDKTQFRRIINMWRTLTRRGKERLMTKEEDLLGTTPEERERERANDYSLHFDFSKQELEKETMYIVSFITPVFLSYDDYDNGTLEMIFLPEDMLFGKEIITLAELEYSAALQEQGENLSEDERVEYYSSHSRDEDEQTYGFDDTENDAFIGTDDFTQI